MAENQKIDGLYKEELTKISKNAGIGGFSILIGALLTYLSTIIATRIVGAENWGAFFLAQTVLLTITVVSTLGLNHGVLRFVSFFAGKEDPGRIKGTILYSMKKTLSVSFVLTILLFSCSSLLEQNFFKQSNFSLALRILIITLPISALTEILLSSLQGLRCITQHALVKNILQPLFRLFLLGLLFLIGLKLKGLLWATSLSIVFGFSVASYFLYKKFMISHEGIRIIVEKATITKFSNPLFFDNIVLRLVSSLPILMLAYFYQGMAVGVLGVSLRLGLVVSLPLTAFNLILAPTIANLYGRGEKASLTRLFKTSTKWIFTLSFAVALILILFSGPLLGIFGSEFVTGASALFFLVSGELINAGVGSVGYILMMTGRPHVNLINSIILFFLTLGFGFLLIPKYGVLGAAITTTISVAMINILRLIEVYYFERIHPYNRNFAKPIIAGILAVTAVYAIKFFIPSNRIIYDLISSIIFGLIFISTLLVLKLEEEDLFILNLIGKKFKFA